MEKKSKVEESTDLLKDLEAMTPDIKASSVAPGSGDELMTDSALPKNVEEDRVAAMSDVMSLLDATKV